MKMQSETLWLNYFLYLINTAFKLGECFTEDTLLSHMSTLSTFEAKILQAPTSFLTNLNTEVKAKVME